jgi:hypothetical protein
VLQSSHHGLLLPAHWLTRWAHTLKMGELMKRGDWILLWAWLVYVALLGPYLISARTDALVIAGLMVLAALLYFTQRRVLPIIKEKLK